MGAGLRYCLSALLWSSVALGQAQNGAASSAAPAEVPPVAQTVPPQTGPAQTTPAQSAPGPTESAPADAQQQQPDSDAGVFVFKKQVEEVMLHATVIDEQRRLVTNLEKPNFSVFEDGRQQTITAFRREDVPVAIGVVVDNSGSMREKRRDVNQAVLNLIRISNPEDEVFVVNFGEDYFLDQDFTANATLLRTALEQTPMRGKTALYDAIVASAKHLKGSARHEKKILLVITDGRDNASQETLQEAAQQLSEQNGPIMYAVGLIGEEPRPEQDPLAVLAQSTGGVAYFPANLNEVDSISRTIARDIRSQYAIGYKSSSPQQNSGYRRINVNATANGYTGLSVRTRRGYYPGENLK